MTAHPDETPTEPAVAVDPPPTGSPVGHLEPEKALATWRAMERSCPNRLDVGMLWASKSEDMQADAARPPDWSEPPGDQRASTRRPSGFSLAISCKARATPAGGRSPPRGSRPGPPQAPGTVRAR